MSDMTGDENQGTRKHGPNGDFVATPETAERDAEAARLRGRGLGYQAIADQLGISVSTAHDAVKRALAAIRAEPAPEVRQLELERLDAMYASVLRVLERRHFTVNGGKVVYHGEEPLEDDGPVLAAVDRLLKIQQRRAALLGLDEPVKAEVGGKLTYEIVGVDLEAL
jgi:hypothetical protein